MPCLGREVKPVVTPSCQGVSGARQRGRRQSSRGAAGRLGGVAEEFEHQLLRDSGWVVDRRGGRMEEGAIRVGVDYGRMHVTFAADGRSIGQLLGDGTHSGNDVLLDLAIVPGGAAD